MLTLGGGGRMAMRLAVLVVALALALALLAGGGASAAQQCAFQDCGSYCSGECAYRPNISHAGTDSLTVWRITPWNVTDLPNHNTGDAAGDIGFLLKKYMENSYCHPPFDTRNCFLDDYPLVAEFAVTFDAAYGPYLKCNPIPIPGSSGLVNLSSFLCAYQYPAGGDYPTKGNPWTPDQNSCAPPCNRANVSVGKDPAHHVWNTTRASKKEVASYFGGYWYSHKSQSQCTGAATPGDGSGCTWAQTAPAKYVNASCLADRLFGVLKAKNPACFAACGHAAGRGDKCFGRCVTSTVLGVPAGAGAGIDVSEMVRAWKEGFLPGGCPLVDVSRLQGPLPA